jgi:hypothetical protein
MSENDCVNDCAAPLAFPRKIQNRAGLSHINYRIGDYGDIREALLRNLDKDERLAAWTHRGADDPGIALLEGAAILGDILTFYQELYANEAYLRTARWRESIGDLVRLLGYRLSPGLGGRATFAFEVKGDKAIAVPKGFPLKAEVTGLAKPADFETSEALTAYPWLSRFNLFRPLDEPAIVPPAVANAANPATSEFYIDDPDQSVAPVELKKGDRLLVGSSIAINPLYLASPEVVIVESTRILHGVTLIKIKGELKRTSVASSLVAFKLGRTFHHFGHAGPEKKVNPPGGGTITTTVSGGTTTTTTTIPGVTETNLVFTRNLNAPTPSSGSLILSPPGLGKKAFPLDAEVQDLAVGLPFAVQATVMRMNHHSPPAFEDLTVVSKVANVKSVSTTWGLVTGTASMVTLKDSIETPPFTDFYTADIRTFLFHETLSPQLTLKAAMREAPAAQGHDLLFFGTGAEAQTLNGRRLFFEPPGKEAYESTVTSITPEILGVRATSPRVRLTFGRTFDYVDFPNEKPAVNVYGNLANATQGKTEAETALGNGDSRQTFQVFKLPKSPLTYRLSLGATPPESPSLEIYVNDRLWTLASTFFNRKYDEEIYIVREDAAGDSWVQFGDGKTGARLPSGVKNVTAKYRTGAGAFGNLKPDIKAQAGGRIDKLDKVQMPGVAEGGSTPEDGDNAREAAPGKIQSLGRLVGLKDFESETLAISGVTRATASWEIEDNIPTVFITVLMETGREKELAAVEEVIAGYNRCRGPYRFPVKVREGRLQYVSVDVTYGLDSTYREALVTAAIQRALGATNLPPAVDAPAELQSAGATSSGALFSVMTRRFRESEYATRIEGTVQNVAGVMWAQVGDFTSLGEAFNTFVLPNVPFDPATLLLPPTKTRNEKISCDGLHILALHSKHLVIHATAAPTEVCS